MSVHPGLRIIALGLRPADDSDRDTDCLILACTGAPSGGTLANGQVMHSSQTAICLRSDGTASTAVYVTVDGGTTWTAMDPAALSSLDLNGTELILDADADTSITADTDNQIDIKISGADDIKITADLLTLLDSTALGFGTPGTDLVLTPDGTDVVVTGTGDLVFNDSVDLKVGTGKDIGIAWDGTRLNVTQALANSEIRWGVDGAGIDQRWYGDTASASMVWDQSADSLILSDNVKAVFGTGSDISVYWDATDLIVAQAAPNSAIKLGVDGAGIDLVLYGDTASASITWDQSADKLILGGVAKIQLQTITAATGTAIPVTHSGSLAITQNGAETNTLADPTYLGQTISIFVDTDTSGARVITAASRINQAGNTIITLTEVGDFIKLEAITIGGALKWQVVANDGAVLS